MSKKKFFYPSSLREMEEHYKSVISAKDEDFNKSKYR